MKKSEIKPRYLGKDDEGIKYYYAPGDASYYKYVDGGFVLIEKYSEYYDEDLQKLGFKEPVISQDYANAIALEYSSHAKRVIKSRMVQLKLAFAAVALTGLLIGGTVEYTRAEADKPLSEQSDDVFQEYKESFRSVIADNDYLNEQQKEDIYFYVVRYLETMDPTSHDLNIIENNIKYYDGNSDDRIMEMGKIFNCIDAAHTYDLLEYLETCEPINGIRLTY